MIRSLIPCLKIWKKPLLIAIACVILESLCELLIPLLMADIIDIGVANQDKAFILRRGLFIIILSLIALFLGRTYAKQNAIGSQGFAAELRKVEYQKIQQFSFTNADHFSTASLITRLTNDVTVIQNSVTNGLRPVTRAPIQMIAATCFSFILNPALAVVFLFAIPVLGISIFLILKNVRFLYTKMQKLLDQINLIIQENITAIRIVKAFVRGDYEIEKFQQTNVELRSVSERATALTALNKPVMEAVLYATIIAILLRGGMLRLAGEFSVGELTGVLSYTMQILNSLMMISNVFMLITRSLASLTRINEVLSEPIDIQGKKNVDEALQIQRGAIRFDHVYFKYSLEAKEDVLSDISLYIPSGSTTGILGGTGSGKSSFVQLIPRLYDVTSGKLTIDGFPIMNFDLKHLRDAIGVVLQKNALFSGTIHDNLLWGDASASLDEIRSACKTAEIDDFIMSLPNQYETVLGQGGTGLSGGQRQRLCIARALIKRPKVLILDDSTSAVDTVTEGKIRTNLAKKYPDMTKIIIAQRISSVIRADQIILFDEGKLAAQGTHESLLAGNRIYQEIFRSQMKEGIG